MDNLILLGGMPGCGKSTLMQKLQDGSLPELSQKLGLSMDVPLKALTLKQLSGRKRELNGLLGSSSEFSPKTPHKDRLQLVLHIDLYALRLPERLETLSGVLLGVQQAKVMTVVCSREELAKRTLLRNRGFPGFLRSLFAPLSDGSRLYHARKRFALAVTYRSEKRIARYYEDWGKLVSPWTSNMHLIVDASDYCWRHSMGFNMDRVSMIVKGDQYWV